MSETKVEETKPAEVKAEAKPAETKPAETKAAPVKAAELKMEDTAAVAEATAVETPAEPVKEAIESAPAPKKQTKKDGMVIYADHGMYLIGVGQVNKGFTLVSQEEGKKWLETKRVREAKPDEVKAFYGVK